MHLGIIPQLGPFAGGVHQYSLTILDSLNELTQVDGNLQYTLLLQPEDEIFLAKFDGSRWGRSLLKPPLRASQLASVFGKLWRRISPFKPHWDPDRIHHRPEYADWFNRQGLDWVFYTGPSALSFEAGFPYIMPVHDLQHRLQPEFPEVSANGAWGWREYLFRNATRSATLILADSESGKQDIVDFYGPYGVSPDRVKVLPYVSSYLSMKPQEADGIRIRQRYQLPDRYLFYPAQFWPHKNHARIVEAMGLLKAAGCEVNVVFCGSYTGEIRERTFHSAMALAHRLGIAAHVYHLGYVPDEDMAGLYVEAVGLVMPTFFGPTNIPVLEAWELGCAVLTSHIRGVREQVGDAGLLIDPRSVEAIAEGMQRLWEDETLRRALIERGHRRAGAYTPADFRQRLAHIIREANERVAESKSAVRAGGMGIVPC